jgi:hypothetical protein
MFFEYIFYPFILYYNFLDGVISYLFKGGLLYLMMLIKEDFNVFKVGSRHIQVLIDFISNSTLSEWGKNHVRIIICIIIAIQIYFIYWFYKKINNWKSKLT